MRHNLLKQAVLVGLLVLGLVVPGPALLQFAHADSREAIAGSSLARLADLSELELADIVRNNRPPEGVESERNAALNELLERHFPFLQHWNPDIRQDVFEKVLKSAEAGSFYSGTGSFRGWLYGIRKNVERDAIRRAALSENTERSYAEREALRRDDDIRLSELRAWFMNELEGMDASLRGAAVLVYLHGFSHAEAARLLSTREGTISSRLHRVREALREKAAQLGCARAFSSTSGGG